MVFGCITAPLLFKNVVYFYPSFNFKYRNWPLKLYEVQTSQLIMMCMFSRQTRVPDFVTKVWWNKYYEKQHNSASNQLLNIIRRHKISFVILHIWKEFENEHLEGNIMYILWTKTKIAKAKRINASIFLTKRLQIIHRTIYCLVPGLFRFVSSDTHYRVKTPIRKDLSIQYRNSRL